MPLTPIKRLGKEDNQQFPKGGMVLIATES